MSFHNTVPSSELHPLPQRHDAALRQLFMLSLDPDIPFADKVSQLLRLGSEGLGLPLGIVSRIEAETYEVRYVHGPEDAPEAGAAFDLSDSYCKDTLRADDVLGFHHAGTCEMATHPCYAAFGLESYIGVPLRVGQKRVGTLNFSSQEPRSPFTSMEVELVRLFGRWLSQEWLKWERDRELTEKTLMLDAIIETVPDGIVAVDRERRIQMVNSATADLFEYKKEEMLEHTSAIFYPSTEEYVRQGEKIYSAAMERSLGRFEMNMRKSNGRLFPCEVFMAPLRDASDNRLGLVGVIRDITDEKSLEKARNELISTVTHELRTPISSMNGALKLLGLERDRLSGTMRKTLDIAARNTERLMILVEDILEFERLSSADFLAERHELSLAELARLATEDIRPYAGSHGVTVRLAETLDDDCLVVGDHNRLLQVLTNLLSNAVKASDRDGIVEVGIDPPRSAIWVRDQGRGIPENLQKRLFERFSRAPESYSEGHTGTGLGMSIVKAIVDGHSGRITFDTAEGEGTTFTVSLPATSTQQV